MSIGRIENPSINVKPSKNLTEFIRALPPHSKPLPLGIQSLQEHRHDVETRDPTQHKFLLTPDDYKFINNLTNHSEKILESPCKPDVEKDVCLLNIEDLHWVHDQVIDHNKHNNNKVYFHELFEESLVVLPKNVEVPRNPTLEKRCEVLKAQQANRHYKSMTKNVDSVRQHHPEDTISYQGNF